MRQRSMDDIGVGVPYLMVPFPIDETLLAEVLKHAAITRGEGLRAARREIAKDRSATLRVILTLLKALAIKRTEGVLEWMRANGAPVACAAGCDHCCYQGVEVSIPEAILASLQVADPQDPRRAAIFATADAIATLDPAQRAATGKPCSFLIDHQCSIYENRPLLCRATISSDARGCHQSMHGDEPSPVYPAMQFFGIADRDGLRGICKDLGLQYDNVELEQTVAAILRDPGMVMRWAAGERVFEPALKMRAA